MTPFPIAQTQGDYKASLEWKLWWNRGCDFWGRPDPKYTINDFDYRLAGVKEPGK